MWKFCRHLTFGAGVTLAIAPCHAQNKPACELLPKSSLETIIGSPLSEPKSAPASDDLLPFNALPRVIASSDCRYYAGPGNNYAVELAVWYMQGRSPESAKEAFRGALERTFRGRDEVTVLGNPAIFTGLGQATYIFKGGLNGLMVLKIYSSVNPRDDERAHVQRDTRIALGIFGAPPKLTGIVPEDQILPGGDIALKGQSGMSVIINIEGITDIRESAIRSDMTRDLEGVGITVYPQNDPPKFPVLVLDLKGTLATLYLINGVPHDFVSYTIGLSFEQLLPLQSTTGAKFVKAIMWRYEFYGAMAAAQATSIQDKADELVSDFAGSWQKVNGKK